MKKTKNILLLQLFAEGASGDKSAAGTQTGEQNTMGASEETTSSDAPSLVAGEKNTDAEFAALIAKGGKYASAFQAQMQKAFNRRFAALKESEASVQRLGVLRDAAAKRFCDIDANDIEGLANAIEHSSDKAFDEEALRLEFENERRMFADRVIKRSVADGFYSRLCASEREMMKEYRGFNLESELKNPLFRKLLLSGANLEDAYWCVHRGVLLENAIKQTKNAMTVCKRTAINRPLEGAVMATIPSTSRLDYKNMSDSDFMALYRKTVRK